MLKAGETWLEGQVPFLALPVVKQVDEEAIQLITDWTFHQLVLVQDMTAIVLVNDVHQAFYNSASENLKIILIDKGKDSAEYQSALQKALADQSALTKFGAA
jgi:hypothetical protein